MADPDSFQGLLARLFSLVLGLSLLSACSDAPDHPRPPAQAIPGLEHIESMPSQFVAARKISIWLPPDYASSDHAYPVLYMHDGQNVFDPASSYIGEEWGVDEAITQLSATGTIPAAIVVGIWNTEARWREYMPQKIFDRLPEAMRTEAASNYGGEPLSDAYLRFVVEELKPYIDSHYRTLSDAAHTSIMGSSMGALISFYALTEYPEVFGRSASVSMHWPLVQPPEDAAEITQRIAIVRHAYADYLSDYSIAGHHAYFDFGDEGLDAFYLPYQNAMDDLFQEQGWQAEIDWHSQQFPGATHNEVAWRTRLAIPLQHLLGSTGRDGAASAQSSTQRTNPQRPIEDEVIYFVMPDRFADGDPSNNTADISGTPDDHGYDPSNKAYFHGGDFKGLLQRLDYLQELGVSALWLTPIFKNKPVQGDPPYRSAGYHGYWITDFSQVDPHLGTNADFKALVEAAHARKMKVIMDIVTNHTADVIQYRGCVGDVVDYSYRSVSDYPYQQRCGQSDTLINPGFQGDAVEFQNAANFAQLSDMSYAYQPWIPEAEQNIKVPAWLNDTRYYHNRGNSLWEGESNLYGDFAGLDDLFTEHPQVLAGMIEIYRQWIRDFHVDGFRIDTAKHVNDSFWRGFIPAMQEEAVQQGIEDFYIFGEVYGFEPKELGRFTREAAFPAVLDFPLQSAIRSVLAQQQAPSVIADVFAQDHEYQGDPRGAQILPIFLGNHDMGRFGHFLIEDLGAETSATELLQRDELAHALLFFARGVPVIYYGDEQGFTGLGNDQEARQDMFPSQVENYNRTPLIGADGSTAEDNFNLKHPLFQSLARMAKLYHGEAGLRRGAQEVLYAANEPGLLVLSRGPDPQGADSGPSYLVVINTAKTEKTLELEHPLATRQWKKLLGGSESELSGAGGQLQFRMQALDYVVYRGDDVAVSGIVSYATQ